MNNILTDFDKFSISNSVQLKTLWLNLSLSGINLFMCECISKVNFELLIMNPQDPMSNYILYHSGYCFALTRLMMPLLSMYLPFIGLINWWLLILSFGWYSWKNKTDDSVVLEARITMYVAITLNYCSLSTYKHFTCCISISYILLVSSLSTINFLPD